MTTTEQNPQANIAVAKAEYDNEKKTPGIAFALWFFFGVVGGHRFYTGDVGYALGLLFTLGGLGVWAFIDVFFVGKRVRELNQQKQQEIFAKHGIDAHAS